MMQSMNYHEDCLLSQNETAGFLQSSLQTSSSRDQTSHRGRRFARDPRFQPDHGTIFRSSKLNGGERAGAYDMSTDTSEVSTRETSPKMTVDGGFDGHHGVNNATLNNGGVLQYMNAAHHLHAGQQQHGYYAMAPKFNARQGGRGRQQYQNVGFKAPKNDWIFSSVNYKPFYTCNLSSFVATTTPVIPADGDFTLAEIWEAFEESSSFGVECKLVSEGEYKTMNYAPSLSGLLVKSRKPKMKYGRSFETIRYSESEQPYQRAPICIQLEQLAEREPNLKDLRFLDISDQSWFAVLWTPVHRLRDAIAQSSILVYYRLRRAEDYVSDQHCRLEIMGIMLYRGNKYNWTSVYDKESLEADKYQTDRTTNSFGKNLVQLSDRMSQLFEFRHWDYEFYSRFN